MVEDFFLSKQKKQKYLFENILDSNTMHKGNLIIILSWLKELVTSLRSCRCAAVKKYFLTYFMQILPQQIPKKICYDYYVRVTKRINNLRTTKITTILS